MPSEAQLKAQMQAAIAKKKQQAETKPQVSPEASVQPTPEPVSAKPTPTPPSLKPAVMDKPVSDTPPPTTHDRRPQPTPPPSTPTAIPFYGHPIRISHHHNQVYFAVIDVLPLSNDPDINNIYLDYKNNPKTKHEADKLISVVSFQSADGSQEKSDGAIAANLLAITRQLQLSLPGPFGTWIVDISEALKTTSPEE